MKRAVALGMGSIVAITTVLACRPSESAEDVKLDASAPATATASASATASATASASASAAASSGPALPPAWVGTFHSPKEPDERNLVIAADGTFFWKIFGCDFSGGDCGGWKYDGTNLVLLPRPGKPSMQWSETAGVGMVTKVVAHARGANLELQAYGVDGSVTSQTWLPGQVCATCGGGLGPTGKLKPCSKPLASPCH